MKRADIMKNDSDIRKTIGERLRNLLLEDKKTQKDVASILSVTENTISYFVNGKRSPNIEQLCTLAEYFDTTTDYLIGKTDTRTNNNDIITICNTIGLTEQNVILLMDIFSKSENNPINSGELDFLNFCLSSKEFWDSAFEAVNCQKQKHFVIEQIENKEKLPEIEYNSSKIMMYTAITRFSDLVKRYTEVKDFEKIVSDYIYHYKSEGGEE